MDRRKFVKITTTTAAASALGGVHLQSAEDGRVKMGQIGTKHAHASGQIQTARKLNDQFEVVGVVEPDKARRAQMESHPAYKGVRWLTEEELLGTPGLQVVAVETEIRDLLSTAQRCVDAGMHIHLDKPAGASMEPLRKLHETAQKKSLMIQMGYMFRYNAAFRFLFDAVKRGWLGEVFEVHGVMSKTVNDATRRELAEFPGGSMFELGCHLIDPLLHILGKPDRVSGYLRNTQPEKDDLADNTLAVFEFEKATATVRSAVVEVDGGRRRQFVLCGDQGTVDIKPLEPARLELTLAKSVGGFKKGTQQVDLPKSKGRYHGAWSDIIQVIKGQKDHEFSHEHDLAVQQALLTACHAG